MIHIITPFSRKQNIDFYMNLYANPLVIWHPIYIGDSPFARGGNVDPLCVEDPPSGVDICYWKINKYIERGRIIDEDLYLFINDDDSIELPFYEKVNVLQGECFFIGMKRGMHQPLNGHPISTLIPFSGVSPGQIGLEQLVVRGSLLKTIRFREDNEMADGIMAVDLQKMSKVLLVTDLFVLFNYLEPGRWDK
jgi:hypothetical protein